MLDVASPPVVRRPPSGGKENRRRKRSCEDDFDDDEAPLVAPPAASPPAPPRSPLAGRQEQQAQQVQQEASVQKLLAASPRAGGLLDALRARGALQALAEHRQPAPPSFVVAAPGPPIDKTFRGPPPAASAPGAGAPAAGAARAPKEKRKVLAKRHVLAVSPPREPDLSMLLRRVPLGPKRPEDNYEISDKEEDSDEEDEDFREEKPVPAWCEAYHEQLAQQENVDPDSIFGSKVPVCNLDLIFPDQLYRARGCPAPKRKRGSSCLWHKDRLSRSEIDAYRQKMGHRRRWSVLNKALKKKILQGCMPGQAAATTAAGA